MEICNNLINVRRNHVFEDGISKMAQAEFEPSRLLSVKFADELGYSEGAVGLGGLTREFLRLAVREAFQTNAFSGTATKKVIVLNQEGKWLYIDIPCFPCCSCRWKMPVLAVSKFQNALEPAFFSSCSDEEEISRN